MERRWLVLVCMVITACTTTSWRIISPPTVSEFPPSDRRHDGPHLLLVTDQSAVEMRFISYRDGMVNGYLIHAWNSVAVAPDDWIDDKSPSEIARDLSWREVTILGGLRGLPLANVRYARQTERRVS